MPDPRDPTAIVLDAIKAGDWRLVELVAHALSHRPRDPGAAAARAYATLVGRLGLADPSGYHRA